MKTEEIIAAPLMRMVNGSWVAKTLTVAVELNIFTIIAESGSLSTEKIADKVEIQTSPAEKLLNACVSLDM